MDRAGASRGRGGRRSGRVCPEGASGRQWIGSGLLSVSETRLAAATSEGAQSEALASGWPFGWLLLLTAFFVLAAECALYHRRKLG